MREITVSALRAVISYDPETGLLHWTDRVANNVFAGDRAGTKGIQGYLVFMFKKTQLQTHRVAWALHHGEWPKLHIDHINGDRSDNRIVNLREATHAQNCANRRIPSNNKCGRKGVRLNRGKWEANIWNGKSVYLGRFSTREDAHSAYVKEAKRLFGEFATGG